MKRTLTLLGTLLALQFGANSGALEAFQTNTKAGSVQAADTKVKLGAPEFLTVGNEPMNKKNRMKYVSPAIFDIDSDGANELVIGTISGRLFFSENANKGSGDPVWTEPVPVKSSDGKAVKLNNW